MLLSVEYSCVWRDWCSCQFKLRRILCFCDRSITGRKAEYESLKTIRSACISLNIHHQRPRECDDEDVGDHKPTSVYPLHHPTMERTNEGATGNQSCLERDQNMNRISLTFLKKSWNCLFLYGGVIKRHGIRRIEGDDAETKAQPTHQASVDNRPKPNARKLHQRRILIAGRYVSIGED